MNRPAHIRHVNSILILSDLYDLTHWNRLQEKLLKSLYNIYWVLQQLYPDAEISINDRSAIDYSTLWGPGAPAGAGELQACITRMDPAGIDWAAYQIVICQPWMETQLQDWLSGACGGRLPGVCEGRPAPAVFCIEERGGQGLFPSVYDLISDENGKNRLPDNGFNYIRDRRRELFPHFLGLERDRQQSPYSRLLEDIRQVNTSLTGKPIRTILVLDDHYRKFHLGDACFWFLYNTKRTLHKISLDARCRINCHNKKIYRRLSEMFEGSFGPNTEFTHTAWEEINFGDYDLVLCHPDSILKLLCHFDRHYPKGIPGTAVYYYDHMMDSRDVADPYQWNYRLLANSSFIRDRVKVRQYGLAPADKEIVLGEDERDWADRFLEEHGLRQGEKIVILIEGASTDNKLLPTEVFLGLMGWLLQDPQMKILLYDEMGSGKAGRLAELYGEEFAKRIVVADSLGIRKDMRLLGSSYVKAVIGPCTGMLHLANSIYTYLLNHGRIPKAELPLLLVYTGKLNLLNPDYNASHWWLGSLVKCAIISKDDNGEKLIRKLGQCPTGTEGYKRVTLPVSEFTLPLLTDFIKQII